MAQHKPQDPRKAAESPAVRSLQAEKRRQATKPEDELKRALKDSFPASDPISVTTSVTAGEPTAKPRRRRDH